MTLQGAWDGTRIDPVDRVLPASRAFCGMSTFWGRCRRSGRGARARTLPAGQPGTYRRSLRAGPGRSPSARSTFRAPKLRGRARMHSIPAVDVHFLSATTVIVLDAASMRVSGIMEGPMWREVDPSRFLVDGFADSVDAVDAEFPICAVRAPGGAFCAAGAPIMVRTVRMSVRAPGARAAVAAC